MGRPKGSKNKKAKRGIVANVPTVTNGDMEEAHALMWSIKRQIADASPDVRTLVINDLIADLELLGKVAR